MISQEFIFSKKPTVKLLRHFLFWLLFSLHFIIQNLMIGGPGEAKTSRTFIESFLHLLYFLPVFILSTYFFLQVILPATLFKKKYLLFSFASFLLLSFSIAGCYWMGKLYIHNTYKIPFDKITFLQNKYHVLVNGFFVTLMLWGIAGGFKLAKKWYEKQKENEKLAQQKIATEIKLLKTQIHPRFLFHSLHSVQQQVEALSKEAPGMILQLADMLSYLLYESDEEFVLLEKEVEITRSYILLQQAGSKNKVDFKLRILGKTQGILITPLILFAFTESFYELFLEHPAAVNSCLLEVEIKDDTAIFIIDSTVGNNKNLMGKLTGFQLQIQNLYPHQNKMEIKNTDGGFMLLWEIPISTKNISEENKTVLHEEGLAV
ncbi:MAG: histidine kinase [Sphingobacteriales bacterium]|nr:histidine kinase [Sphingobacteriales bacterium]